MTSMNESILKADRLGRLRFSPEQKKAMVDAYRSSGLSAPRFAAHHGINYQTLVYWVKKEKSSSASAEMVGSPAEFFSLIPAVLEEKSHPPTAPAMEISLSGGAKLSITCASHVALAAALIRQLELSQSC
jgi:transposase-like protein